MPQVGRPAPDFELLAITADAQQPRPVRLEMYRGRWLALIFYPRDFSFVCPTELTSFSAQVSGFHKLHCELLGISIDTIESHRRWLQTSPEAGGLGPLQYPLASDPDGLVARAFGLWNDQTELPNRGLFLIDPRGIVQYAVVHNLSVGRNVDEILRVLEALQSGGLCPANWTSADGTIDPEQMLQPGRVVGHYRILKLLGQGTFGTVFAAEDLRLGRRVALKVLKRAVDESREALLREARAAAAVDHPNVCTIYAVDEHDGLPVIAMQYIEGRPLSAPGFLPVAADEYPRLAVQVAQGLAAAHRLDTIHGDLKPANILISVEGVASIVDFGLNASRKDKRGRRVRADIDPTGLEQTSDFIVAVSDLAGSASFDPVGRTEDFEFSPRGISGTPAYLSPEQGQGHSPIAPSDVFSLGLIYVEMLTGQRVLDGGTLSSILDALQDRALPVRATRQLAEPYRPLIAAMLNLEADRRPSAAEVAAELQQIIG